MSITEPRKRELAAVMFTDMVGFTALMQQDEQTGIENRTRWTTAMERHHGAVGGEVVQWFGDGALSRFPNTVDAIACAIGIQTDLRLEPAVDVRIGIHVGNVMMEPTGLLGDAVNIASRVESFATPGSVVISDTVHDQIKNQPDLSFVDLGKVRFKNVGRPFTLYAIADEALAVPDSGHLSGKGDQIARFPGTIPERGSQLIGREGDVERLRELLDEYRVVTVTGPGGVGKTSIALELCHQLRADFLDGVAFVDLSAVTDPDGVIPAVAETLDIKEAEGRSLAEGVAALIGDSQALVVLDNMEQVVDAAYDLANLLSSCPLLTLLVTSRGPLHIAVEQEYPLIPLGLPDDDDVTVASGSPAVALFVAAARRAKPGFELTEQNAAPVAAICRRLDGLPLAIELAAARIRLLSPQALLERLGTALDVLTSGGRDRPGRHQALRATIDWSHQQLSAQEQQLFRRLSVFAGGATIDGIEAVCSDSGLSLDTLDGLVDHALIQASGDRFGMLQTIWEFAGEQLASSGEADEIQDKYAYFMHGVTMAIRDGIEGGDQVGAIQRGVDEDTNITAALDHLLGRATAGDAGAAELALQICGDLWMFWHVRGKHLSARHYALELLAVARTATNAEASKTIGVLGTQITLGLAYWTLGQFPESVESWTGAHRLALALGATREEAIAAFCLMVGYLPLDLPEAVRWSETARTAADRSDDWARGFSLGFAGAVSATGGDLKGATALFTEALSIQERIGDYEGAGISQGGLALIAGLSGDLERSLGLYEKSLAAYETIGDRAEEARILGEMAWIYLKQGNIATARTRFLDAVVAYQDLASVRGIGLALIGLASVDVADEHFMRALEISAAAELFIGEEGIVNAYLEAPDGREYLEGAKAALSPDEVEQALANGGRLSVGDAIRFARTILPD